MILFFRTPSKSVIAVECNHELPQADSDKLCWLFGEATPESEDNLKGHFVGPRREMITPWSTNAVEITQNMGLDGIIRIEEYFPVKDENADHDPMLQRMYKGLDQNVFTTNRQPEPIVHIEDLEAYNEKEGLALSKEEMDYLKKVEKDLGRPLTDSEVFGFAQINSEHCRHKIFNASWTIDGEKKDKSLFSMIRETHKAHPEGTIVAYSDNAAIFEGGDTARMYPRGNEDAVGGRSYSTVVEPTHSVFKVETHNHPTAISPFPGASTGSGGEIRDEGATGRGARPKAGLTGFTVSALRLPGHEQAWENDRDVSKASEAAPYYGAPSRMASPLEIMIEGPLGGAAFNNEFGRPNILGYFRSFEANVDGTRYGYHKPIMLAGGLGNIRNDQTHKLGLPTGTLLVVLGVRACVSVSEAVRLLPWVQVPTVNP